MDGVVNDDNCCCMNTNRETIPLDSGDTESDCVDNMKDDGKTPGTTEHIVVDEFGELGMDYVVEPKVGMVFETAKDAYNCYDEYARRIGFRVRIQRTNMNKAIRNKIHRQTLVCSCQGSYTKIGTPRKRRENRRFDCLAKFEFKLVGGDKYTLIKFIAEHSHDLVTPQRIYLSRPRRKVEGLQTGLGTQALPSEVGGDQHLNSIGSDCNNLVLRIGSGFFKRGDAQFLIDHFKQKKRENKHFFYSFRTNEDSEINSVFFCDAKSRRDYGLFGDVMCFDTTFRTNNYSMVCALIVGINNHGQTILFGCGLLDGETTEAMVWLFTTFLEAMGGKNPRSIFTDQSIAIMNAISVVFPEAHHGVCLWHIFQNARKHLAKFKSLAPFFKACIYDSMTIEEFEQCWNKLLQDYELKANEWLKGLYELRQKWAPVYSRAHFCAGMTTPQRNENISKFLKDYFGNSIALPEFVGQYLKAMTDLREKEKETETKTQQTSPILISGWSAEREAAQEYTKEIFYCFQEEYRQIIDQRLHLEKDDGKIRIYRVTEMEGRKKSHTVTYNHSEQSAFCACRNFEFNGILCSHALKIFRDLEYMSLPRKYYMKRWTRGVINEVVFDSYGDPIPSEVDPSSMIHHNELSHISQRLVTKGARSKDVCSLTKTAMLELEAKIEEWLASEEEGRPTVPNSSDACGNSISKSNEKALLQARRVGQCQSEHKSRTNVFLENPTRKASSNSKPRGGRTENMLVTRITTGASSIHQPTQESFGLIQQPTYCQNGWQGTMSRSTYPLGFHPVYNFMRSQGQSSMAFLPSDLFTSQQASSSEVHVPQQMPQGINFSDSSRSNFASPSTL